MPDDTDHPNDEQDYQDLVAALVPRDRVAEARTDVILSIHGKDDPTDLEESAVQLAEELREENQILRAYISNLDDEIERMAAEVAEAQK